MKVSIIAAVARNGIIGVENHLPWHLPEDLAFFKKTTLGSPILMGRKTYESINRPLPRRLNVVLSTNSTWEPAPAQNGTSWDILSTRSPLPPSNTTALARAHHLSEALQWLAGFERVFLIGGSNLYTQALAQDLVDELILTEIDEAFEGDAHFPVWSKERFQETQRTHNPPTDHRNWGFDFVTYHHTSIRSN